MACISPIKVPTNTKKIYVENEQKLINYVPCGKCFECLKAKMQEIMVRMYYDDSDFYIFDTLTYSDENVKHLKDCLTLPIDDKDDMLVLYYKDYQDFMKRLRKNISKYDAECKIKYLVAGEYGTKRTLRPHIHIILCVKNCKILPIKLSKLIKRSWKNGLTDGVDDKGIMYFNTQRLFKDYEAKKKCVGYVCKYMCKVSSSNDRIKRGIKRAIINQLKKLKITSSYYEIKEEVEFEYKKFKQFVRWSKGFGIEFINDENEIKKYEKNGYIQIKTDLQFKKYNLPLYYRRILYNYYDKDEKRFYLNDRGIKNLEIEMNRQYQNNIKKLKMAGVAKEYNIERIARYWTYYKDRYIVNKKSLFTKPNYNGEYIKCENSKLDRQIYQNGRILDMSAKEWINKNICRNYEFDRIIEETINILNKQLKELDKWHMIDKDVKVIGSSALERTTQKL